MSRANGARSQILGAFEASFGAGASSFMRLPFVSTTLGAERNLEADDLAGTGRDPLDPVEGVTTGGGDMVVPVDLRAFGHWLRLVFGAPVTAGSTGAYTHTYGSGSWSLPSMAVEMGFPEVPHYPLVDGVMANSLELSLSDTGFANATLNLLARKETPATTSRDETPDDIVLERFGQFHAAIKSGGNALAEIVSATLNYNNNLDPARNVGSAGLISGADPQKATCTGNLQARFASTALLDLATNKTALDLEFSFTISSTKKLTLTAHRVFLPKPKTSISGPAGIQVPFAWQAVKATSSPSRMVTAVLANDVASYA